MKENNILIDDSFSEKEGNRNYINYNKNFQKETNDKFFQNKYIRTNNNFNSKKNSKKVNITDKVEIIDVECWKKYNLEQTADENIQDYLEELAKNEEQETKKSKNSNNNKRKKSKTDNVFCTCILI